MAQIQKWFGSLESRQFWSPDCVVLVRAGLEKSDATW